MSEPRRIVVVGAGYVGLVTGVGLASLGHSVEIVETRADRLQALTEGRVPIHEAGLQDAYDDARADGLISVSDRPTLPADVAMVCVGTPISSDGRSDLSQLRSALVSLAPVLGAGTPLVVRSTLPPGSTRQVVEWSQLPTSRVLTNPEFLRQGTALHDFLHPTRIVIGHFPNAPVGTIEAVRSLFAALDAPVLVVDVTAAELIKNGANAFLALKLSFTNEMAALAEEYGTDVGQVLGGIALDPRIGGQYMKPGLGFGGSCLPKELRALAVAGAARGLPMQVTNAASEANTSQQLRFARRVGELLGGLEGRTVAILGLAFKAGTDDVRESPAIGVARMLMAGRATLRAYDPQAGANALRELPELDVVDSVATAIEGADAIVIATEWPEFRELDWCALAERVRPPIVIDGRRLLDAEAVQAAGLHYHAVGNGIGPSAVPLAPTVATTPGRP